MIPLAERADLEKGYLGILGSCLIDSVIVHYTPGLCVSVPVRQMSARLA